ncbi:hypothetical protein GCM10007147_03460 [Nocardiopsis kunsanensis]|uniref:Uncharacterized protein n=1 Tax=Nocardiopsis kunsanensis TaxID=141693 RepID=A0A918X7N2_9ACTN|nr:hypothetical protein GCM10007147_03460 [Nocardiopsis kunsanensis]
MVRTCGWAEEMDGFGSEAEYFCHDSGAPSFWRAGPAMAVQKNPERRRPRRLNGPTDPVAAPFGASRDSKHSP